MTVPVLGADALFANYSNGVVDTSPWDFTADAGYLIDGHVYLILIGTGVEPFALNPPLLSSVDGVTWWRSLGDFFGSPNRWQTSLVSPSPIQLYAGIGLYSYTVDHVVHWGGIAPGGTMLWIDLGTDKTIGMEATFNEGYTAAGHNVASLVFPALTVTGEDSTILRGTYLETPGFLAIAPDHGDTSGPDYGQLGGYTPDGTSSAPWSVPQRPGADPTEIATDDNDGNRIWLTVTIAIEGTPVLTPFTVATGWKIGDDLIAWSEGGGEG